MKSNQGTPPSDERRGVNLEPILKQLGYKGRYQMIQLFLNAIAVVLFSVPLMDFVFLGYKPDYKCRHLENDTQMEDYLPDDVTNFTLHDVRYEQCSIDVTVNSSGTSSIHSLPCVAGVNFSMPSHTSFLTEWSLVCDKAGLAELTQTGLFAGQIAGRFLGSVLADRYGRRKVYVTSTLCLTVCLTVMALAVNYYMYIVCKIVVGVFIAGMVRSSYTLFVEMLPQQWRHIASVASAFTWVTACLFMAATAYGMQGVSWRYLSLALYSLFIFTLVLPWTLDESIRWLLATGRIKEAEEVLKKACRMNGKDFEKIHALLHKEDFTDKVTNSTLHHDHSINTATDKEEIHRKEVVNKERTKEVRDEAWMLKTKATNGEQNTNGEVMNKTEVINGEMNKEVLPEDELQEESRELQNAKFVVDGGSSGGKASGDYDSGPPHDQSARGEKALLQEETFSARYTILDLFRHRILFVPFCVTVIVWMTNNLYYYGVILGSAQLSGNRFLNFSLLTIMDIPSTFVTLFLLPRWRRGNDPDSGHSGPIPGHVLPDGVLHPSLYLPHGAVPYFPQGEKTPWAPGLFLGCMTCLASFTIWLLPETRQRKLPDTIEEIQAWRQKDLHVS
ncbi:hypothetical protein ACOMHN_001114 [Nucella lapillus]